MARRKMYSVLYYFKIVLEKKAKILYYRNRFMKKLKEQLYD